MDARAVKSNANIASRYGRQMSGYGHPMRMRLKQILDILSGCWNADILCGCGNTAILWGCRSIESRLAVRYTAEVNRSQIKS